MLVWVCANNIRDECYHQRISAGVCSVTALVTLTFMSCFPPARHSAVLFTLVILFFHHPEPLWWEVGRKSVGKGQPLLSPRLDGRVGGVFFTSNFSIICIFEFLNCVSFLQSNCFSLKKETYFPLILTEVNSESESVDDYYFLLHINLVCFIFQK